MSDRGSFVTQYIYCAACLDAAKSVLLGHDKWLCSQTIDGWSDDTPTMPIIAGKIADSAAGGEILDFEMEYIPALEKLVCHPLRIAVLPENGDDRIFVVEPASQTTNPPDLTPGG